MTTPAHIHPPAGPHDEDPAGCCRGTDHDPEEGAHDCCGGRGGDCQHDHAGHGHDHCRHDPAAG